MSSFTGRATSGERRCAMKLRQKILLLAIVPLVVAWYAVALAVRHQASALAFQQRAAVKSAYLATKQGELRHYVSLGIR